MTCIHCGGSATSDYQPGCVHQTLEDITPEPEVFRADDAPAWLPLGDWRKHGWVHEEQQGRFVGEPLWCAANEEANLLYAGPTPEIAVARYREAWQERWAEAQVEKAHDVMTEQKRAWADDAQGDLWRAR